MKSAWRLPFAFLMALAIPVACSSGFLDRLSSGGLLSEAGPSTAPSIAPSASGPSLPTGCDASASFCDTFDDSALGAKWTDAGKTPNGSLDLVEGAVSPPYALRARFLTGTVNTEAYLTKFVGGSDTIRCELDLMIVSPPEQGEVDYLAFITNAPGNFNLYKLYFTLYDGQWNLGEYGLRVDGGKIDRSHAMGAPPPIGKWTHVVFQTSDVDPSYLSIAFDDAGTTTLSGVENFITTSREVEVGITFASNNANSSSALYDNVNCDWTL